MVLSGAAGATIGFAVLWLLLMRHFPKDVIMASLIAQISLCSMLMVVCFFFNALGSGVCFMLITILLCLYLYSIRNCIPFAAAMLTIVCDLMRFYPQCYWLAVASLIPQVRSLP